MESRVITLKDFINILKRNFILIIVVTSFLILIAYNIGSKISAVTYYSECKVFIGKSGDESYNSDDILIYNQLINSYVSILKSYDTLEKCIHNKNITVDISEILNKLNVLANEDDQVVTIGIILNDKFQGQYILDDIIDNLDYVCKEYISGGSVKVISEPKTSIIYDNNKKIIVIAAGGLLGLLVSLTIGVIRFLILNPINDDDEAERILGAPVIGEIPYLRGYKNYYINRNSNKVKIIKEESSEEEIIKN